MNDRVPVGVVERLQDAVHDGENLGRRYGPSVEPVAQRLAADEFQDDVVRPLDLLHVVDLDQVRVAGPCHHLGFLEEALQRDRVGGGRRDQLLDRHLTAEPGLLREVHGAHAAASQLAFDHVLADVPLGHARRRRDPGLRQRRDQPHGGGLLAGKAAGRLRALTRRLRRRRVR